MSHPAYNPNARAVAEVQGLYGAFSFPERLLQKIWARGDCDLGAARCADGRDVTVIYPGKWNHLGGPDFCAARLKIGGVEVTGDVELHLHARDWAAHRHASDPAYDNVVLHVVLFPGGDTVTQGGRGRTIPVLCLLPLLHRGLEEYAADEVIESMAGRPLHHAQEILGALSPDALSALLLTEAQRRWTMKVHYARERIARLGWEGACHHAALEILGYRFNRAPMLAVATAFPFVQWSGGRVDPAAVYASQEGRWSVQGVRPANQPRLRLRQYAEWCRERPDWPVRLAGSAEIGRLAKTDCGLEAGGWRRAVKLGALRKCLQDGLCAGRVGGSRLDNLFGDGFLPLVAAGKGLDLQAAWMGWQAGDAPDACVRILRILGVFGGHDRPVAQGAIQGLLGWMLARETEARG
jgi:hypothetical protein